MQRQPTPQRNPSRVLERFPRDAGLVRRLLLSSREFRSVCEDYSVAQDALAHFKGRPDAHERPEIGEYETLIRELEAEIAALVETTRAKAGSDRTADGPAGQPCDTKNT